MVLSAIERAAGKDLTRFLRPDLSRLGKLSTTASTRSRLPLPEAASSLSRVTVRRFGDGIFPTDVLVTFDDGEQVTEQWDEQEARWREFTTDARRACNQRSSIRTAACSST